MSRLCCSRPPLAIAMQTSNLAHAPTQQRRALCTPAGFCRLHTYGSAQRTLRIHRNAGQREPYSRWVQGHTLLHGLSCCATRRTVQAGAWLQQTVNMASSGGRFMTETTPACVVALPCSNLGVLQPMVEQSVGVADDPYAMQRVSVDRWVLRIATQPCASHHGSSSSNIPLHSNSPAASATIGCQCVLTHLIKGYVTSQQQQRPMLWNISGFERT